MQSAQLFQAPRGGWHRRRGEDKKQRQPPGVPGAAVGFELSYLDSNQDRQNQKLQCYHYTIRQSCVPKSRRGVT